MPRLLTSFQRVHTLTTRPHRHVCAVVQPCRIRFVEHACAVEVGRLGEHPAAHAALAPPQSVRVPLVRRLQRLDVVQRVPSGPGFRRFFRRVRWVVFVARRGAVVSVLDRREEAWSRGGDTVRLCVASPLEGVGDVAGVVGGERHAVDAEGKVTCVYQVCMYI